MPNYSPKRKLVNTTLKDIKAIPFDEAYELFTHAKESVEEEARVYADTYNRKIREDAERKYADDNPESGSYEGNWDDALDFVKPRPSKEAIDKASSTAIANEFAKKYGLDIHASWLMPQIITMLGSMPVFKNTNGKYSGIKFKYSNFTTPWSKGVLLVTLLSAKACYLPTQYKAPTSSYAALTPLVMYSQKLVKGIPYSAWDNDPSEVSAITHQTLADAMTCNLPEFNRSELLELRTKGLLTKSTGVSKNPISTHYLVETGDPMFDQLPSLARIMLAQTWLAHPTVRNKYMILNPLDWDNMPNVLVDNDILLNSHVISKKDLPVDTPW